jgi:hypothetical protein
MEKIKTSPTQIDLVGSCPRRWYLRYRMRLPVDSTKATTLGDVGHGVCERWYDQLELYPEGWEEPVNRFTGKKEGRKISKIEQAIVQKLVAEAVENGMLTRLPGGEVEKEFKFNALEFEDYNVTLRGFIDYFSAPAARIEDHKFCKAFKWYGKEKLKKAIAMNAYAYAAFDQGLVPKDRTIWIRYNLFCKDPNKPKTKPVEVELSWEMVENFWKRNIEPRLKDMVLYSKNADTYNDVPCAEDRRNACSSYGQTCPFFGICEGQETPEQYKERKDGSVIENRKDKYASLMKGETLIVNQEKEKKMQGFNDMVKNSKRAAAPGEGLPPQQKQRMPWYNESITTYSE